MSSDETDPLLGSALKHKQANQSTESASSDQGPTTIRLCFIEAYVIFSHFRCFQAGSVDFERAVKH